jgi:hypothetical protein
MPSLRLGSTDLKKLRIGSTTLKKAYIGTQLVWQESTGMTGYTLVATTAFSSSMPGQLHHHDDNSPYTTSSHSSTDAGDGSGSLYLSRSSTSYGRLYWPWNVTANREYVYKVKALVHPSASSSTGTAGIGLYRESTGDVMGTLVSINKTTWTTVQATVNTGSNSDEEIVFHGDCASGNSMVLFDSLEIWRKNL